ncbi:HEAT repeat domain-containing protein [Balneolaceae bacterium YR4-1]|uniref:HEAT repeat domain-containing protein n=1 Tax=Halalkalibaculum roseum TaxID=2709311 RepID=A0A6M1SYQ7_9BACT|nr:HEAT repeat domain-containing protein [Halalkalibaculum roseum]NGP75687.1 HEAT repeat domain-containing protein [Halalkalibaculum roseum]
MAALTLLLFISSIVARTRHWTHEQLVKTYQNRHFPLILEYLDGERTEEEIENSFRGEGIEFSVFEDIIFEMLENLEGEDAQKLRQLLYLSPIFNYHFQQLNSSDNVELIKACNYFSYVRLVNYKVIKKLQALLSSENKMLVFSAASALMASKEVGIRKEALRVVAGKEHYSRMALLEMVYNFHDNDEEQLQEEGRALLDLIEDENIPPKSAAVIIEGASEIGYQNLLSFLLGKLNSTAKRWRHPDVLKALIKAQGDYYNSEALPLIKKFVDHTDSDIRKSIAYALGKFGNSESLELLYKLLHDSVYEVKVVAAKSLYENGEDGQAWLQTSYEEEHLNIKSIVNTL